MYQFRDVNEAGRPTSVLTMSFGHVASLDTTLSQDGNLFQTLTVDGRGLLPIEAEVETIGGRPGRFFKSARLGTRSISVSVRLFAPDHHAFRLLYEKLNLLLAQTGRITPQPLRFSDEVNRYYQALFVSADIPDELSHDQIIKLWFMCYDPFKYSNERTVSGNLIQYNGHELSYPQVSVTLRQAGSELRLLHVQKQQYVRLRGDFNVGDVVVFDMAKRTVSHRGRLALERLDMVHSRFFALDQGANNLSCNLNATIETQFREVFR